MTPTEVHQLLEKCKAATKGDWQEDVNGDDQNIVISNAVRYGDDYDSGTECIVANTNACYDMPEKEKYANAVYIAAANPQAIQTLAENYLAALEVIKYYRGSDDDETSWMEPDQHLMYWTLWNDGDCVGGKVADDFLKKVGANE